jgi:hypothetical protein
MIRVPPLHPCSTVVRCEDSILERTVWRGIPWCCVGSRCLVCELKKPAKRSWGTPTRCSAARYDYACREETRTVKWRRRGRPLMAAWLFVGKHVVAMFLGEVWSWCLFMGSESEIWVAKNPRAAGGGRHTARGPTSTTACAARLVLFGDVRASRESRPVLTRDMVSRGGRLPVSPAHRKRSRAWPWIPPDEHSTGGMPPPGNKRKRARENAPTGVSFAPKTLWVRCRGKEKRPV